MIARMELATNLIHAQRAGHKYGCTACGRGLNVFAFGKVERCECGEQIEEVLMNPNTGEILSPKEQEKLQESERAELVPIPNDVFDHVQALDREQRKGWARAERERTKQALKSSR